MSDEIKPLDHIKQLAGQYDKGMRNPLLTEYYGNSGYFNYGYWTDDTPNQAAACVNLVEKLLVPLQSQAGHILDVACGEGATTRHLLQHESADRVTGVNISTSQLAACRLLLPDTCFVAMDAVQLGFGDHAFDNILCVEAAFHFDTRQQFLAEAYRVLRPGGRLALSDILFLGMPGRRRRRLPNENYVTDLRRYRTAYQQAGFSNVHIVDATRPCWIGFRNNLMRWGWHKRQAGAVDATTWSKHMLRLLIGSIVIRKYVLVWAQKA